MLGYNQANSWRMVGPKGGTGVVCAARRGGQVEDGDGGGSVEICAFADDGGGVRDALDDDVCAAVGVATATVKGDVVVVGGRQSDVPVTNTNFDLADGSGKAAGEEQKGD
jgi:hypothetical protein